MDALNFYYLQRVLESELDLVQTNVATALKRARVDLGMVGVHDGGTVTQSAPPALTVQVVGPAYATDPDGERVAWATTQTVNCAVDHLGSSTAVVGALKERWISVIAEYNTTLATPVTDGNGTTVWTRIYDGYTLYVSMAAEGNLGDNVKPALPTDGVLLADVRLVFGQVQILAADISTARRQDLVRVAGTNLADCVHGTLLDAIVEIFGYVDAQAAGGGVTFAGTGTWKDTTGLAATNVSAAINEIVTDLAANAGAARVGGAAFTSAHGHCDLAVGSIQSICEAIATAVDAHINGGAPAHPASAVTTTAIAGSPESIGISNVQAVLAALYGHINARTERSTVETVDARWIWQNTGNTTWNRARQSANQQFQNAPFAKTLLGGSVAATYDMAAVSSGLYTAGLFAGEPWSSGRDIGAGANITDLCMFQDQTTKIRYVGFLCDKGGAGTYPTNALNTFFYEDRYNPTGFVVVNLSTVVDGLAPAVGRWRPMSCCSDGHYVYVLFEDYNGAASTHHVQAYDMLAGTKHPGWPVGGLELTGIGQSSSVVSQRIKVVELDFTLGGGATKLAVLNSWVSGAVAGTSQCVSIVDATDGTLLGEGCGDMPVSGGDVIRTQEALASDGTNVYFGWYNWTTGAGGIATLQIAAPATGKATGTWPFTAMPAAFPVDLLFDGNQLWSACNDLPTAPIGACILHCVNFETDSFVSQALDAASTTLAIGHLAFDGLNVWVQAIRDMDGGGTSDLAVLYKLPVVQARPIAAWTPPDGEDRRTVVYLQPGLEVATVNMDHQGRTLFDGDGVHVVLNSHSVGDALEGKTRYVTQAHKR